MELAVQAAEALSAEKVKKIAHCFYARNLNVFDKQDEAYRESVLPAVTKRVAIEAGIADFWV